MENKKSICTFHTTFAGINNKPNLNTSSFNLLVNKDISSICIPCISPAFTSLYHNIFSKKQNDIHLIYSFYFENSSLWYKGAKAEFDVFWTTITDIQIKYSSFKGV